MRFDFLGEVVGFAASAVEKGPLADYDGMMALSDWAARNPDRVNMLSRFSINGFGILARDLRELQEDGSLLATDWLMVAFFPVAPLRTRRVLFGPRKSRGVPGVAQVESQKETTVSVSEVDRSRNKRVYLFYYAFLLPAIVVPGALAFGYGVRTKFGFSATAFWTFAAAYLAWGIGCFWLEDRTMQQP